jgi:hydroxypyruvate isomerase
LAKFAANLSMMFTEVSFVDRFAAAADAGFHAVEFLFPYEQPAEALKALAGGLDIALFNTPAGDWNAGERGLGARSDRIKEFRDGVRLAIEYALILGTRRLHVMAGKADDQDRDLARRTLVENVRFAADLAAVDGLEILLEPINTKVDMPGYFYGTSAEALSVIEEVDRPNVKLQYDIYHMQIMEGDLARSIERLLPHIGHVQIADNPGRGEPGTGEINYPWLLKRLDALGYDGFVGCEYRPSQGTVAGLTWMADYV